jgi:transcriptional regulator with GAF, ATPase, and Fis domain
MILARGPVLHVPLARAPAMRPPEPATTREPAVEATLRDAERAHILRALEHSGWRIRGAGGAAARLEVKPTTLEARMVRLGIRRIDSNRS